MIHDGLRQSPRHAVPVPLRRCTEPARRRLRRGAQASDGGFLHRLRLVSLAATASWIALVTVSLGLFLLFIPPLWPIVAFFYNGLTVAGPRMATPGMRVFDLEMRALDGGAVSFVAAACHGVMLYLSWLFPPVFLASLLTDDKRCLHDVFAGVIIVRRPFD